MSTFDEKIAAELEATFERDLECCYRITEEHLDQRSVKEWFADSLAWRVRDQL